jgi:hypothetical protein
MGPNAVCDTDAGGVPDVFETDDLGANVERR